MWNPVLRTLSKNSAGSTKYAFRCNRRSLCTQMNKSGSDASVKPTASTKVTNNINRSGTGGAEGASKGPVTYASLALAGVAAFGILFYYNLEKEKRSERVASKVTTTGKAALGGPWVLVDQDGIPRTDASYKGQYTLLYFGFSFCPDICPSELVKVGKVLNELTKRYSKDGKTCPVQPLFISVDPARDTVGQLKHYAQDFHENMIYLTGTKEQIAAACKSYRVYFSKANENEDDDEDYLVDHSIVFYLISPEGEFLDFFTQRMQLSDVIEKVGSHIQSKK